MSFFRHQETHQPAALRFRADYDLWRARSRGHALAHRIDESPVGYSLVGCSPAEPASASPTEEDCATEGGRQQLEGVNCWAAHWSGSRGSKPSFWPAIFHLRNGCFLSNEWGEAHFPFGT